MIVRQSSYDYKEPHETTTLSAFYWWLSGENFMCDGFCPLCKYYYRCQEDVKVVKEMEELLCTE